MKTKYDKKKNLLVYFNFNNILNTTLSTIMYWYEKNIINKWISSENIIFDYYKFCDCGGRSNLILSDSQLKDEYIIIRIRLFALLHRKKIEWTNFSLPPSVEIRHFIST